MSQQLTVEQQRKIEENRQRALERRAQRLGQTVANSKQNPAGNHCQSKNSNQNEPAGLTHHRGTTTGSAGPPGHFVPPFKKVLENHVSQNQDTKPQHLPGFGKQTGHSIQKQVRSEVEGCYISSVIVWEKKLVFLDALCSSSGTGYRPPPSVKESTGERLWFVRWRQLQCETA